MEIRTLAAGEHDELLELLNDWEIPDGWQGRDFFRRYLDDDPSYDDENIHVAEDSGRLIACVQIFPRRIRILGHAVPAGGIGTVFTAPDRRGEGISSRLLAHAVDAMVDRKMEVSLLFGVRTQFYRKAGWEPWRAERSLLMKADTPPSGIDPTVGADAGIEIHEFDPGRDFAAVKAIHSAYSASRNGTVVRADELWQASLILAGNPAEEFLVARQGGAAVAYVRCAFLNGLLTMTELARTEDAAVPLALLMARSLEVRDPDPLTPASLSSRQLRSALLLPVFDDLALTVALEHRGFTSHPFEDLTTMLRCLNMNAMAERLDIALFPDEVPGEFLKRILPQDSLVFWPADRF
jgi:predicted N-acetyltransferase YhbS